MERVDEELQSRFTLLRFTPAMEAQFENDCADERCRKLVTGNYAGLIIYHLFLISDFRAIRDAFGLDLVMHFGVVTPLVLGINQVLLRRPSPMVREGAMALGVIVLALSAAIVVAASQSPLRDLVQFCIVMVVPFTTMVQRLRFWYAMSVCVAAQVFYGVGLAAITPISLERVVMLNCIFAGIAIFSLIGCFNLEHEMRTGYLLRLRDRIRSQDLETISLRDALTGIGNRRALDDMLRACVRQSRADPQLSTAVLLLDIDHFKDFNDTNGHQEGDICLTRIAGLITLALRHERGEAYRFGGEEFIVILNDTSLASALAVAERVRMTVEQAAIPRSPGSEAVVTVSIGAAAGCLAEEATPTSLVADADRALYAAKRRGRNFVCPNAVASGHGSSGAAGASLYIARMAG